MKMKMCSLIDILFLKRRLTEKFKRCNRSAVFNPLLFTCDVHVHIVCTVLRVDDRNERVTKQLNRNMIH